MQRIPRIFPAQPRGILRFLLRLLSTRKLHSFHGYVHRKRPVHERRNRQVAQRRHLFSGRAGRRHRGFFRVLHIRLGRARRVFPPRDQPAPRTGAAARRAAAQACGDTLHAQRRGLQAFRFPRARGRCGNFSRQQFRACHPRRIFRRRNREHRRRGRRNGQSRFLFKARRYLPCKPLRRGQRTACLRAQRYCRGFAGGSKGVRGRG